MSEHVKIKLPADPFIAIGDRLERLGIKPHTASECGPGVWAIHDGKGRHFFVTDILDRLIDVIERLEGRS